MHMVYAVIRVNFQSTTLWLLMLRSNTHLVLRTHVIHRGDQTAKQEMLHDRQFAQDFFDKHPPHALFDFFPALGARNVIQHRLRPFEALDGFRRHGETDHIEVHELVPFFIQQELVVDTQRPEVRMMEQLACAEKERQELVIVKPPNTVRSRRLEVVGTLDIPHKPDVPRNHQ